jgi:hypothetical protein
VIATSLSPARILVSPSHIEKMAMRPLLFAINGMDRADEPAKVRFWAQAWKAAHQKARAIGWLRS